MAVCGGSIVPRQPAARIAAVPRGRCIMHLATYKIRGRLELWRGGPARASSICARGCAAADLGPRSVARAGARRGRKPPPPGVRPDVPLAEVELLPPVAAPEKILCIGVNYANREAGLQLASGNTEIPEHVLQAAQFAGRARADRSCGRRNPSSSNTRARSPGDRPRPASACRRSARSK